MKKSKLIYFVWGLGLLLLYLIIIAFSRSFDKKVIISLAFATVSFLLAALFVKKYIRNATANDNFLIIPTWVLLGIYLVTEYILAIVFSLCSIILSIRAVVVTNLIIQIIVWILIGLTIVSIMIILKKLTRVRKRRTKNVIRIRVINVSCGYCILCWCWGTCSC